MFFINSIFPCATVTVIYMKKKRDPIPFENVFIAFSSHVQNDFQDRKKSVKCNEFFFNST